MNRKIKKTRHYKQKTKGNGAGRQFGQRMSIIRVPGVYVPDCMEVNLKMVYATGFNFISTTENQWFFNILNLVVPITGVSSTGASGLKNLLGSQSTSGAASGLYSQYVVKSASFTLWPQTTQQGTGNGGISFALVPLPYGQANDTITASSDYEQSGVKQISTTNSPSTSTPKPLRVTYYPYRMHGLPWSMYRYSPLNFVNYLGNTTGTTCYVLLSTSNQQGGVDATLVGEYKVEVVYNICLFNRNQANVNTPTLVTNHSINSTPILSGGLDTSKCEEVSGFEEIIQVKSEPGNVKPSSCGTQ